ncbi:ribonuclease H-like domain-containing protein [Haematococcus lacustris]
MLSLTDLKAMKREEARPVIAQLVQQLRLDPWAFDGRALLLSLQRAPQGLHEVVLGAARYEVDLKWTGELDLTRAAKTLLDFTASQTPATAQQLQLALGQEALQALDVLVRSAIARRPDLVPRATSYYSASNDESAGNMEGGCMAARGFSATLDLNQRGLTLAVDSKVTPFIKEQLLTELIAEIIGVPHRQLQSSRQPINAMQFKKLRSTLKGLQVEMAEGIEQTRFKKLGASKGKPRGFTIKGVDKVTPDDYKFRCEDLNPDQDISIATYFKKKYGVDLQYPLLPCICVNERRKISMPAEVLRVKVQPLPRKPTASQTAALVTMAAVKPHIRRQNIMDAVKRQSGLLPQSQAGSSRGGGGRAVADADEPARVLAQFGVQIKLDGNSDMMRVPARVIPPPKMQYQPPGPGVPRADPDVVTVRENGSWTLEARRFFQPAPRLDSWAVLVIADEQKVASALQPFLTAQREALQGAGVDMAPGQVPVLYLSDYRAAPLRSMFQDAVKAGTQVFGCAPKLLLFVLETKRSDAYKDIKLLGDCELGVVTQCVTCEKGVTTRNKPSQQQQYCRNVALKINTKLKGVNHVIHEPDPTHHPQRWLPEPLRHKRVMAVGIDVNHDSATQPSMAAVVASMDPFMTSYAAQIITQPRPHEEFISPEDMQAAMEALLMMYVKRNKALPEVLLVWRDGVADSQIDRICGQEYVAIHKACDESGMDMDEGRIVFTSVQKRHNTRLFPERKPDEGSREQYGPGVMANVQTGTVVEGLGSPEFDDFILVSQHGGMGTSRGARYLPLVDELGLTADERQRLTYWMCFLYGRCTMPVSVPAPVYHADRAAMRGRVLLNALRGTDDSSDIGSVLSGDIGGGSGALGPEGEAMAGGPKVEIHDRLKDTTFFI